MSAKAWAVILGFFCTGVCCGHNAYSLRRGVGITDHYKSFTSRVLSICHTRTHAPTRTHINARTHTHDAFLQAFCLTTISTTTCTCCKSSTAVYTSKRPSRMSSQNLSHVQSKLVTCRVLVDIHVSQIKCNAFVHAKCLLRIHKVFFIDVSHADADMNCLDIYYIYNTYI